MITKEYLKQWRKRNAKRIKAYNKKIRKKKSEYCKQWYKLKKERDFRMILNKAA
jgi:hypothetical protein